ncbi:MAG: DeoR/GlpR family DNA-binding transcription regulator [Eubacterium sp.]|nr:DeoR/GlpR family DNA-binding transcription regulator [Eubacterium sp.]
MLTEERLQLIQTLVEEKKSVSTQEVMDALGISESTVRRDFSMLDSQGRITKVRGGAMAKSSRYSTKDDAVSLRKDRNQDEKRMIARYAASLIEPDDFVYLDAGTTTELMIDYLTEKDVVFVTNAVTHARKLSLAGYTTYILGGEFKVATEAIVGDEAIASLQKYNFTKGFWGTNGVSKTEGFSTPDVKEAMIKKTSISRCASPYVLCDSSKFSRISCVKFEEFVNAFIITTKVDEEEYGHCKNVLEVSKE